MPHRVAPPAARLLICLVTIWFPPATLYADGNAAVAPATVPAEFERQEGLLLSWNADDEGVEEAMTAVVSAVYQQVHVIVLTPDDEYLRGAMRCFSLAGIPQAAVRYVRADVDTIWTRDYGPASLQSPDGSTVFLDADYETGTRSRDDELPGAIAPILGLPSVRVPLTIEGGNLLSNGRGLCLATTKLRDANLTRGYTEQEFRSLLRQAYGFSDVVFLEPLEGESTGHVDMFATFVATNTVIVGEYDPEIDPVNAAVLDRNAEQLGRVWTPGGRLRVVRVPMPPSGPDVWRTYTNVVYANGTLLVPSYPGVTPHLEHEALTTFQHLLPEWRIVPVDCNQLISLGGGIHCVTLNLSRIARLPRPIDPRELPEAGGVFPGDAAIPQRRLIAAQDGWQPFTGGGEVSQAGPSGGFAASDSSDFDTADECEVCCPTGDVPSVEAADPYAAPWLLTPDVPRTRRVPAAAFRRRVTSGDSRHRAGMFSPRAEPAAPGWHE